MDIKRREGNWDLDGVGMVPAVLLAELLFSSRPLVSEKACRVSGRGRVFIYVEFCNTPLSLLSALIHYIKLSWILPNGVLYRDNLYVTYFSLTAYISYMSYISHKTYITDTSELSAITDIPDIYKATVDNNLSDLYDMYEISYMQ